MKKFVVDKKIFDEYENLKIGVIVCRNIDNTKSIEISKKMNEIKTRIKEKFDGVELAEYPIIRVWRNIYKSFGEKKARSSVESLIRRTINGNDIPNINPLVDIYNYISLKYELPCGGEDIDTIKNDMQLTYAEGTEKFLPLGETEIENPNKNEIIYKYDDTVICRNFNYRESDITKLTENTKNAILILESVNANNDNLERALDELSNIIKENLGGENHVIILDNQNSECEM